MGSSAATEAWDAQGAHARSRVSRSRCLSYTNPALRKYIQRSELHVMLSTLIHPHPCEPADQAAEKEISNSSVKGSSKPQMMPIARVCPVWCLCRRRFACFSVIGNARNQTCFKSACCKQPALGMVVSLFLWVSNKAAAEAEVTTCALLVELALYPGQVDSQLGASALLAMSRVDIVLVLDMGGCQKIWPRIIIRTKLGP